MKVNRRAVYDKFDGHCAYCGNPIHFEAFQVDHVVPKHLSHFYKSEVMKQAVNANGDHVDSIDNMMPSCRRCNHYKRGETLKQFRKTMITLHQRVMQNYICKVAKDYGIIEIKPFDGVFYFEKHNPTHQMNN